MANFDQNGYLFPHEVIEMSYEEFVRFFVMNEYRVDMFENFKHFLERLKSLEIGQFSQWINGSFVSKKPKPLDIDVVTFIDYKKYEVHEQELRSFKTAFKGVDCYYVKEYPNQHPKRFITNFDRTEWMFLFSTDRRKLEKGFVQLKF